MNIQEEERKRRDGVAAREPLGNTCGESRKKELVRVEINPTRKKGKKKSKKG